MKKLEKRNYSFEELQRIFGSHINEILSHYPDLDRKKINSVGIIEDGRLQLKVPDSFKNRQVIMLIGFLRWLVDL